MRRFFAADRKYSWKKVTLILTISTLSVSGSAALGCLIYRYAQHFQITNEAHIIQAVVQTGCKYAQLQTSYLAEELGLSADYPVKLGQFDLNSAREKLLGTGIIRAVHLKKIKPNLLFIDYNLRDPYVFLADYSNTAIDKEGVCFPFAPFYPPTTLPHIYVGGSEKNPWGTQIDQKYFRLLHTLFTSMSSEKMERVDLSRMEASTAGKRELIILLKGGTTLRLHPLTYKEQLAYYSVLKRNLSEKMEGDVIVDLRIPEVAFISKSGSGTHTGTGTLQFFQ